MALHAGICTALNKETLETLRKGGIKTVIDFVIKDPETLSQEFHLPYKDLCSIRRVLLAEYSAYPVSAGDIYHEALSSLAILSTGCSSLDKLLDGGIYTGEVTELAGDTATGKTKVCLWCAGTTVKSGLHSVVYIDTCSSFSPECLLEVVAESNDPSEMVDEMLIKSRLEQIKCIQVFDVFDLFAAIEKVASDLNKEYVGDYRKVKLLIVDNLASLIYPVMGGQLAFSQSVLTRIGMKLKQLAINFSIAVVVTNNMVSSFNGSVRKPALGKAWSHVPHTRVSLQKPVNISSPHCGVREARLVKSSRQETSSSSSTTFSLNRANHNQC